MKLRLRILAALLWLLSFSAWSQTIRTQDLKVFKLELQGGQGYVGRGLAPRALVATSLGGGGARHDAYRVVVSYEPAGQSNAVGFSSERRAYAVSLHEAKLINEDMDLGSPVSLKPELVPGIESQSGTIQVGNERFIASSDLESQIEPNSLAYVDGAQLLAVSRERMEDNLGRREILLLSLRKGSEGSEVKVFPLVNLSEIGIKAAPLGFAVLNDQQTLALIPSLQDTENRPMLWLVRLPGTLSVSSSPVYILSALSVTLALVMMYFAFRKS